MLKHVQSSPTRKFDSVSLRSSSSSCGSPEPSTPSRASSYSSLNETTPQTTVKIYTACLKLDIEYKTLGISWDTTAKEVVLQLLRRCKMRHRDPRLFYLTMEITIKRSGARTCLILENDARIALLQACYPSGDSKFCLQSKPGGLIRVHTSVLNPTSQYKSLMISEETTSDELLGLLLSCFNSVEPVEQFSIYEVCPEQEYQRKLHPDDLPLITQMKRNQKGENCHFLVRRNPILSTSSRLLIGFNEKSSVISNRHSMAASFTTQSDIVDCLRDLSLTKEVTAKLTTISNSNNNNNLIHNNNCINDSKVDTKKPSSRCRTCSLSSNSSGEIELNNNHSIRTSLAETKKIKCIQCKKAKTTVNTLKDFSLMYKMPLVRQKSTTLADKSPIRSPPSYHPVYNIREIRTHSNSFSAFGSDQKILDIESQFNNKHSVINNEAITTNPGLGVGNFVYI